MNSFCLCVRGRSDLPIGSILVPLHSHKSMIAQKLATALLELSSNMMLFAVVLATAVVPTKNGHSISKSTQKQLFGLLLCRASCMCTKAIATMQDTVRLPAAL